MRASSSVTLASAFCGAVLIATVRVPFVQSEKVYRDLREGEDYGSYANCGKFSILSSKSFRTTINSEARKVRYLQIEGFDYNRTPWMQMTWRQLTDECGNDISDEDRFVETATYDGGDIEETRLQMDMYICAPWGNYELEIVSKSENAGEPMAKIAWEVEYGPKEYHIWDVLNTPHTDAEEYAPIPTKYNDGDEDGDTYTWPLDGSEGYYSVMYSGPFPPLECSNLHPSGIEYIGCYPAGMFGTAEGPSGSANSADPAENYRMYDGIDDAGIDADDKVMTLEKCRDICLDEGTSYFGLESAVKCLCGNTLSGSAYDDVFGEGGSVCGVDYTDNVNIAEYKFLCSGDSRVLCGTDDYMSVYSLDGSTGPAPSPVAPSPVAPSLVDVVLSGDYESVGCYADVRGDRAMSYGPVSQSEMSAEICHVLCLGEDPSYLYFGTQYGKECWCSEAFTDHGDSTACDYACASNDGEICGGYDALSVYAIGSDSPTPAPVTAPAPVTNEPTPDVSGDGFVSVGCRLDDKNDRIMGGYVIFESPMSAEICFKLCNDGSNTHFGTQYGAQCFCVDDPNLENVDKHGELDAANHCQMDCEGVSGSETCGGYDEMSVYEITDTSGTDSEDTTTEEEKYTTLGCFEDPRDGSRAMDTMVANYQTAAMSAEICYGMCIADDPDFEFFGLQYGAECWCSKTFSESSSTACDMPCAGNGQETCGGYDAITAFAM